MSETGPAIPLVGVSFEKAASGLVQTDAKGTILRVNTMLCRWIGYDASDLVQRRRLQELFTMGGRVFYQTHWAPLMQIQGSVSEVKLDMVHRDGHSVPMLINAICHHHEGQTYQEVALMMVTDRHKFEAELLLARSNAEGALAARKEADDQLRRINAQLSEADRRKDEFLATLAHELRNPLAPMRNVLQLMKLKDIADPQIGRYRDVLERQMNHLTHLVDDLLEVSRITQGKLELSLQPVNLTEALQVALEAAEPLVKASLHTLHITWPAAPICLDADPIRLTQMVQNLINNAAKYTPPGGQIWVGAELEGDQARISVRDSGIGIPQEHLSGIFEMFSQLAPALERSQGGLGIGLSLVRGLTDLHGGTITAHSGGPGLGSEFVIRLPAKPMGDVWQAPTLSEARPTQVGQRILVVDDNHDAAESLQLLLELQGHEVKLAGDGQLALAMAQAFQPDVLLLDIGLPFLNGYEVARLIRQEAWGKAMCLVALTGWGQAKDKQIATEAGFDWHLTKPVNPAELDSILDGTFNRA
ncbi:MAG: response regulator [Rubrivivax sp.]|nr:MAG: response regulator [Rubrivivax sp.]